jgi:hydroxyacylglutathione hydrolase
MALDIVRIPVLSDNYIWLVHEPESGETLVVDPALAQPVLAEASDRGWQITQIWNTHWHPDHVGGNLEIQAATGCTITGPAGEAAKIPGINRAVQEGDVVTLGSASASVIDVPAHTAGHNAYHFAGDGVAFVGDTLFAMGCGRLFEGTAAQMFDAMRKLAALPDDTAVYCAHEYTLSNAKFAVTVEPDNADLGDRFAHVVALRDRSIAAEKATNPFMRAASVEELAARRAAKDSF